jgi:3-hydroxyacyl-CoA dehydrogenase / enoyl-CoA hydratase / 3-hydroxybutyryl-CoA epimerase
MAEKYNHWKLVNDDNNIIWCHFDKRGSSTNVLSTAVFEEFNAILDGLPGQNPKGLVIVSDKSHGFIAGADIHEFTSLSGKEQALELIHLGQALFGKLESLPFPTLCQINGFCLGGGLELALACHYRIALNDPGTRLGLPEVRLGFHPGWGGTLRLVRLIGAPAALDLMLSGRTIDARTAKKLGVVDRVVPLRHLDNATRKLLEKQPRRHRPGRIKQIVSYKILRPYLGKYLRRQVKKKAVPEHYPAPYALIDLWEKHWGDKRGMLRAEANSVADLITTPTARNLIRVFLLQERLKSLGQASDFSPAHVHVIGAGVMGGEIAAWCALQGLTVTLQDREPKYIAPALKRAHELFCSRLKLARPVQAAMDRLIPDHQGRGVAKADVLIEAIVEDLNAKQSLYSELEPRLRENAVLATNTSSIPLDKLSRSLSQPERLVGIHFFNPVASMQLVEIVRADHTDGRMIDQAAAFCRRIDRLPLPVKSSPGFLVNRILMPYLMEAMILHEEGTPALQIDRAATAFGMPMGPIELADTVGLDICLSVADILAEALDWKIPEKLREMVNAGRLGRKSGRGFYEYRNGKPRHDGKVADKAQSEDLADRLILPMINEAVACLREGVIADADLLDAGMIFGTGFAPFRGGPMHYLEQRGRQKTRERLVALEEKYGGRFHPDDGWQ